MTYIYFLHFTSVCFVWKSFSTFFTRIRKRFLEFILSVHELLLDNNWNKVLSYKQPQQQQLLLPTVNVIVVSALDELNFGLLQFGEIVGKKVYKHRVFLLEWEWTQHSGQMMGNDNAVGGLELGCFGATSQQP